MKQSNLKNKHQIGRFAVVGVINTALDFILLFLLKTLGLPAVPANFISSTTAFTFSFTANKRYTFKSTSGNTTRQIILFVVVTLTGLWVFQNIIIYLAEGVFIDLFNNEQLGLLVSKLLATAVSMTWNYIMYAVVVFKQNTHDE
ncbi:MAG: GtrA family protein [Candidatus Saccharimonadales bacterium]